MSFLWPLAWALSALALPIIAFYLIRTRLQRKPVSTLLFWEHLTPQVYNHSLWRKLRRWISLALQLLFLFLLILAISQPLTSWQSTKPASLILLLDSSVTMTADDSEPSRWKEAIHTVERRIAHMRLFDEAILIAAGETPRVLSPWTRNKRALSRALETAKPGQTVSDIRSALTLAHNLASQRNQPEILLISDGVWNPAPESEALKNVQIQWVGGKEPSNTGLTLFTARRSHSAPGEYQLIARVYASAATNSELEVRRDGVLIDVQSLKLEPGKPWQKTWDGTADGAARFEARLTGMKRDDLPADNVAESTIPPLHPVAVEVVAPPHAFLDAALESLPLVQSHRTWPQENLPPTPDPSKLYVFYRAVPPDGFHASAMLLIDPGIDGFWGKYNGPIDSALVSEMHRDEPILRFVSLENVRLDKVSDFTPSPGATLFAECIGGTSAGAKPLLFGQWKPNTPRWLVQSFGLEDSDLVFRTAFPVMLANLIQSLHPEEAQAAQVLPGPTATQLKSVPRDSAKSETLSKTDAKALAASNSWWFALPLWWWALILGVVWLLAEWGLFSRRITE